MKRLSLQPAGHALAALAAGAAVSAFALVLATPASAADANGEQVKRGRHLVQTSGCHDCHTPFKMGANGPEPDMSRMLSGHPEALVMPPPPTLPPGPWLVVSAATNTAYSGPWGVSFSANLTPDADTGLGQWKASDFRATIRSGRHMGRGRPVLPPMPVPVYNNFSDAELDAIFAYLRTVPAVKNRVPEPAPAAAPAKP
jgi:mono/diheme cytochrome c family protein